MGATNGFFIVLCCVLCALISVASAFLGKEKDENGRFVWNNLKVKWGLNPFSNFNRMPLTTEKAIRDGFTKISDCDLQAKWRGFQYIKDNDYALILLYDVNGYIAGIQTSMDSALPNGYPTTISPPFVDTGDRFILTAYFVNPDTICTTGRTFDEFTADKAGTNLYIQNGTDPETDSIMIPRTEDGLTTTRWTRGKCFYTMGVHYWHDLHLDSNCLEVLPMFLLYNRGQLTGFGWALMTDISSPRMEHPPPQAAARFMTEVPTCLAAAKLSTMHIYLTNSPYFDLC